MAPISLLLICDSYPPVLGGSEIEAQRVAVGLRKRGFDVRVVCAGGRGMPELDEWTDPLGVPVRIIGGRWSWIEPPWRDYLFALGVAWTLVRRRRQYRLVYFLMQGLHLATGLPAARFLGKPVVMKFSGSNLIPAMRHSFWGRFELRCLERWAKRVMVLNDGMVQEALEAGLRRDLLLWMPNPVNTAEFSPVHGEEKIRLREQHGLNTSAPVTMFVGRLSPEKQLPSLLYAFERVLNEHPEALLTIAGDGPERTNLEALAQRLGIAGSVRFTGRLQGAEVLTWLRMADLFALVSSQEGFPVALLEAMSVGLPSVVSAIPANSQLVEDGVHGLSAPVGDSAALAASMGRLLTDPALRIRMGQAARERVAANYSTDRILDRYEALFAEALGEAR